MLDSTNYWRDAVSNSKAYTAADRPTDYGITTKKVVRAQWVKNLKLWNQRDQLKEKDPLLMNSGASEWAVRADEPADDAMGNLIIDSGSSLSGHLGCPRSTPCSRAAWDSPAGRELLARKRPAWIWSTNDPRWSCPIWEIWEILTTGGSWKTFSGGGWGPSFW